LKDESEINATTMKTKATMSKRNSQQGLTFITSTLLMLALVGTFTSLRGAVQGHEPKVHDIGVITLFDDPAGVAQIRVLEYVAEELNQKPSLKHRARVAFHFADGGCDPDTALNVYREFLNQGIHTFIGGLCSDETLGFAPFLEQDHAVALSATSSSDDLASISPNVKLLSYKNSALAQTIGAELCQLGAPVAIVTEADSYTENLRDQVTAILEGCGTTPVANVTFDSQTDLEALMTQVRATGAESLFLNAVIIESGIGLLQAIEAVNWSPRPQLYGDLGIFVPAVLSSAPSVVPGMILAGSQPILTSEACGILRDIEARHPGTLASLGSFYTWTTYQAGILMGSLAVVHQGDAGKIARALSTRTFKDAAGLSAVHGGNVYFGKEVFAQGVETFAFTVQPDLSVEPPSCP
jgi:ABC-type branched-subunit amino acid transport system substrate-binding protein